MCCVKCASWKKAGGMALAAFLSKAYEVGRRDTHNWSCMLLVSWCVRDGAAGGGDQLGYLGIYLFAF